MRFFILVLLNIILMSASFAQEEKEYIREGNNAYHKKDYKSSEILYRKALAKKNNSFKAAFNLGDALFRAKKWDEAAEKFENIAQSTSDKTNKAKAFHNLGNTYLQKYQEAKPEEKSKYLQKSLEAYKNALRNNPNDEQTRYNLAYTQRLLKKQQQKDKNQQNKKNKDQKDKKKQNDKKKDDKKNQDNKKDQKKKDDKNQKQKNQKNQDKKQDKKKQEQQKQKKISKKEAEKMLNAIANDEKKLQKKMKKMKGKAVKIEKDW